MLKQDKGITLIALIITIIVMMILVAVSVTVALDGGLFRTAKKAASETELKAEEEMLLSAIVGAIGIDAKVDFSKIQLPDGFTGENGVYESSSGNTYIVSEKGEITGLESGVTLVPYEELTGDLKTAMDEGKITAVLKETKDGIEMQAVIPAGFKISTKSGENTISGGLVIIDVDGNEFVWVPCTTNENDTSGLIKYAQDKRYNDGTLASQSWYYSQYSDWTDEGGNSESVAKYSGFYVGRYEAGIPSNAPFYANGDGDEYIKEGRNTTEYIPVSKANNPSWNWISQPNAKTVSENMYSDSTSVESSLIDSYAWDTIVNWMENKNPGAATNSLEYGNVVNSTISITNTLYASYTFNNSIVDGWTTYPNVYQKGIFENPNSYAGTVITLYEITTGSIEDTNVLNIYDMTGNMWELTTEVGKHDEENSEEQFVAARGGGFNATLAICARTGDFSKDINHVDYNAGFRVVLYIK